MGKQNPILEADRIVESLKKDMLQGCWYAALYERIAFRNDIGNAFGYSFEAWGLIKCCDALLDSLILLVTRVIGGGQENDNAASLNSLLKILKGPGVFKIFEGKLNQQNKNISCNLVQLEKEINKIKSHVKTESLRNYRNAWIAHKARKYNPQKHKLPKYEDALELFKLVIPVMDICLELIKGADPSFKNFASIKIEFEESQKTANDFWEYAAHLKNKFRNE